MSTTLPPGRAFGYLRVSTGRQFREGDSIEAQRAIVEKAWKDRLAPHGIELAQLFQEQASAFRVNFLCRPAARLLESQLRAGDHVLFAFHTRAFRKADDWSDVNKLWVKKGVFYHFCNLPVVGHVDTTTALGWGQIAMLMVGSQMESEMRSQNAAAMHHYFRTKTNRSFCNDPRFFERFPDPETEGQWLVRPVLEPLLDVYQMIKFTEELGFTFLQAREVTEYNRRAREWKKAKYIWCSDDHSPKQYESGNDVPAEWRPKRANRTSEPDWQRMMNFYKEKFLPNPHWSVWPAILEQAFAQRWAEFDGEPQPNREWRGMRSVFHLMSPRVCFFYGAKTRNRPVRDFADFPGQDPVHKKWPLGWQPLSARPRDTEASCTPSNGEAAAGP